MVFYFGSDPGDELIPGGEKTHLSPAHFRGQEGWNAANRASMGGKETARGEKMNVHFGTLA